MRGVKLILFCILYSATFAQRDLLDSLTTLANQTRDDTNKVRALNELGWQLLNVKNDYSTAFAYVSKASKLAQELDYEKGYALSLNLTGVIHHERGNYSEALKNYLLFLKLSKQYGLKKYVAYAYGNIGSLYFQLNNYAEARKNQEEALEIFREINSKQGIANALVDIGNCLVKENKREAAIKNYNYGIGIYREIGDSVGVSAAFENIGAVNYARGALHEALRNFNTALAIRQANGETSGIAKSEIDIANVYLAQKMPAKARPFLLHALTLSGETGSKTASRDAYRALVTMDSLTHNYNAAFNHHKMFIVYRDSLFNEEITKRTLQAKLETDFERKQVTDSLKNVEHAAQEKLKHTEEIKQQKILAYCGVAGFILMVVVAAVSFRAYRNKQKANAEILEQKKLVDEKQKEIIDSIRYARRIQTSLLPSDKYIERILKNTKSSE